jgi:hypothetical protein
MKSRLGFDRRTTVEKREHGGIRHIGRDAIAERGNGLQPSRGP